jgi:Virulence factor membrane-bound polymerase, C-terminal/O-Antigen ligase/Protein glycosylation ligase
MDPPRAGTKNWLHAMLICILGLVALTVAWVMPGHYYPWTSFHQEALATAGVCLVGLGAAVTARDWPARIPALAVAACLLAVVPPLQWAAGLVPFLSDAAIPSAYLLGFALAIVTGMQMARSSDEFVPALCVSIGTAGFVSVGLCLAQWLQLGPYGFLEYVPPADRLSANFLQPNQLASLLGMGVVAAWWAYEAKRIAGWAAALAMAFLGAGMVMTQSRAAWLFVVVYGLFWVLYRNKAGLRTSMAAVVAGSALFAIAVMAWGPLNLWLTPDTRAELMTARWSQGGRWLHWQTVWDALWRSPWVGYGWMQISAAQKAAVLDHPSTFEWLSASHNQFLDFLVWNGVPLGLMVIGVVVWWAVTRMGSCRDVTGWSLLLALGVLFAHSMVEFPLQYSYFLLPAGLMIGAIEARIEPAAGKTGLRAGRPIFAVLLVGMSAFLYLLVDEYLQVEESVRRIRLREAGYVQPGAPPAVPDVRLLDGQRELARYLLSDEPTENMPAATLDWMRTVVTRYSPPPAMMRYALAMGLNGREAESRRALEIMCRIAFEKHCNAGRTRWAEWTKRHPKLSAVPFPGTPPRP